MSEMLPPATQKFIADTREYNDPLNRSAELTTKFGRAAEESSIVAQRAMNNAAEATRKLELAEKDAAEAADKFRRGMVEESASIEAATRASKAKERADLALRESALAAASAADKEAAQMRQVARDAALMDAAQYASAIKTGKATASQRKELEQLVKVFPELRTEATRAMKEFSVETEKAALDIGTLGKVGIPAAALAIENLPEIAQVAGGGVTLAMGAAASAIGLKMQAGSATGKAAIDDLKTHAESAAKRMTQPFQVTWNNIDLAAHDAAGRIEPELTGMFSRIAQADSRFVRQTGESFGEMKPMITDLGVAYDRVLGKLGDEMPTVLNNVSTGFDAVFHSIEQNPQAIADTVQGLSEMVRVGGDVTGWLIRSKDAFDTFFTAIGFKNSTMIDFLKYTGLMKTGHTQLAASVNESSASMKAATFDSDNLISSFEAQSSTVDQLKAAFDRYTGANQSAATAEINMQQAIDDTTQTIKRNGQTIDTNTQKGRDNYKQLIATAKAFQDKIVAMKNDGATANQVSLEMGKLRDTFLKLALQMTGNQREAQALTDKLFGVGSAARSIPTSRSIKITDNTYTVRQHIADLQRSITNLRGKTVTINELDIIHRTVQAERADLLHPSKGGLIHRAGGGPVQWYPDGGLASGPGSGTSDSIPAMISNGEFVVNAQQTAEYLPLLQAINSGLDGFKKGGSPKHGSVSKHPGHFTANKKADYLAAQHAASLLGAYRRSAESAWMTQGGVGSGHGVVVQHITNVTVMGSLLTQRELDDHIQEITLQRNLRNPTSGTSLQPGRIGGR